MLVEGAIPGNRVLEVRVHERPVDVEDRDGGHPSSIDATVSSPAYGDIITERRADRPRPPLWARWSA